jgi:hypothetical protein
VQSDHPEKDTKKSYKSGVPGIGDLSIENDELHKLAQNTGRESTYRNESFEVSDVDDKL